jgi:hypothetical protein
MRTVLVAVVLGGWLTGCAHFECTVHGGREVRSITTEHFVVTSDLAVKDHRREAERLELLWDTFAAFFGTDVPRARIPVVVLDGSSTVQHFASGYVGFVLRRGPTVLVVGAAGEDDDGRASTNAHELTHLVSAYLLPRQPRWVAEGLGTLFEDATFRGARTVKMGRWNAGRAQRAFYEGAHTLGELQQWGGLRFDGSEDRLYASAWAWLHYLVNRDEARLQRLFAGLRSEKPIEQVMAEVFPPEDAQRLHAEVTSYLGNARYRGWETSLRRNPKLEEPVVLAPWEVHALRSRLFLRDEEAVKREEQQAVALAPTPLPPRAAVLNARLTSTAPTSLVAQHPDAPEVLVAAWGQKPVDADREKLARALERAPDDVELLLLAAEAAYGARAPEVDGLISRGVSLAPWSIDFVELELRLALQRHDCAGAERVFSRLQALAPERPSDDFMKAVEQLRGRVKACAAR